MTVLVDYESLLSKLKECMDKIILSKCDKSESIHDDTIKKCEPNLKDNNKKMI
jgi:hypothetical protein